MTDELLVTPTDCEKAGVCPPGVHTFAKAHGIDLREFVRHGVPASVLRATGDPDALRAVAFAERRVADGRRR